MSTQMEAHIWQNDLLTVREVATYLRVGRVTVWRWCQEGTIPASRLGRSWRIHRNDLSCFLEKRNLLRLDLVQSDSLAENHHQNHLLAIGEEPGDLEHGTVVYPAHETERRVSGNSGLATA